MTSMVARCCVMRRADRAGTSTPAGCEGDAVVVHVVPVER